MTDDIKTHLGALTFVGASFGIVVFLHWLEVSLWAVFGYAVLGGALYALGYNFTKGGLQGVKSRQTAKDNKFKAAARDKLAVIQRAKELYPKDSPLDEARRTAYYMGATEDSL